MRDVSKTLDNLSYVTVIGGAAYPIRNTQLLVTRDQPGHQRKAIFRDRHCYEDFLKGEFLPGLRRPVVLEP
jgi:hypothetical protein